MKKNWLLLLLTGLLITVAACKKDDDDDKDPSPEQDLAAEVAGTYELTYFRQGNQEAELPAQTQDGQTLTGTIELDGVDETTVRGTFTLMLDGDVESEQDMSEMTLEIEDDGVIRFSQRSQEIGTYEDDKLQFEVASQDEDGNPIEVEIRASK